MKNLIGFFLFESELYKQHTLEDMEEFEERGRFKQISLSDSELKKLRKLFPKNEWEMIEELESIGGVHNFETGETSFNDYGSGEFRYVEFKNKQGIEDCKRIKRITSNNTKNIKSFIIRPQDDEWYLVDYHYFYKGSQQWEYYVCDQWDGLVELLKDKGVIK
jgi:hypothetical protein